MVVDSKELQIQRKRDEERKPVFPRMSTSVQGSGRRGNGRGTLVGREEVVCTKRTVDEDTLWYTDLMKNEWIVSSFNEKKRPWEGLGYKDTNFYTRIECVQSKNKNNNNKSYTPSVSFWCTVSNESIWNRRKIKNLEDFEITKSRDVKTERKRL